MTMSHADDASGMSTRCPDKGNESSVEPADRYESGLSIVSSIIYAREVEPGKNLTGAQHVESAISKRVLAFGGVAGYAHSFIVSTNSRRVNRTVA